MSLTVGLSEIQSLSSVLTDQYLARRLDPADMPIQPEQLYG
ncbi:hypothetical protein [Hydrogenophaga sp.]|nr:hypothetical protein [Hydrogenophaga sp.]